MLINDAVKKIEELKEEMAEEKEEIAEIRQDNSLPKTLEVLTASPEVETTPFFRRNYPDFPIVWNEEQSEQEEEE